MVIAKDDKDWTWVIERSCADCGFDPARVSPGVIPSRLRQSVAPFARALAGPKAATRPSPDIWSPLEYAAHVRDVARTMDHRLELILTNESPRFADWDQDQTALDEDYAAQDPALVIDQLHAAIAEFANAVDEVPADAWDRPGTRSNGSQFTAYTLAVYALHDVEHHVWDVERVD